MSKVFPQPELAQLLADIEAAFGGVRLGGGVSLHQARAMDDHWVSKSGVPELRARDPEERWQDIPDETVDAFGDTLGFMDGAGFRFYMPRFMVYALTHAGSGGSFAVEAPVRACSSGDPSLLSAEQRRVVARFLRLVAAHHRYMADEAAEALRHHWGQYG